MLAVSILAGLIGVFGLYLAWWNRRRVNTGRVAAAIPDRVKQEVLAMLERAGARDGTRVLLLRVIEDRVSDPFSKIGGELSLPAAPGGPAEAVGDDEKFMAQVRLRSPPLPEVWSNRVICLFRTAKGKVIARCAGQANDFPQAQARVPAEHEQGLEPLCLPPGDTVDNEEGEPCPSPPYDPSSLFRRVPAARRLLEEYSGEPERLLPHILVPGIHTHEIDTFLVSLMGGEPELIQNEHAGTCPRCSFPMAFLFQMGDVLGLPGDAPVVYVYGCAEHPVEVEAYVDAH